jgi:hypothetical protein
MQALLLQLCKEMVDDFPKLISVYVEHKEADLNPHELLDWWRTHGGKVGSWAAAARRFALCQPNSALAERAGSIVRARTSDQQGSQLEETFEVTCMLAHRYAETRDSKASAVPAPDKK